MTPDQQRDLDELSAWVMAYPATGRTRREFWLAFDERAASLDALASSEDADPDLRLAFGEIWDDAHERFGGPESQADDVMD